MGPPVESVVVKSWTDAAGAEDRIKITVLMAVYESPLAMLRKAVDSVLAQTYGGFEFLILDDGSSDPALLQYLERLKSSDPRVRVAHEPHRGLTQSLNRGLELASGEWIARQDADDWSAPARLEKQLALVESHPAVSLCGSNVWTHQQSGRPLWRTRLPLEHADILAAFPSGNPFVHGATLFSRCRALAMGGYREAFPCAQDYDFFWRLAEEGVATNLEEPLYHYRYRPGSISAARAAEQVIVCRAARELARARTGASPPGPARSPSPPVPQSQFRDWPEPGCLREVDAQVSAALEIARTEMQARPSCVLRTQLKQADHLLLAGEYRAAFQAYLGLIAVHPHCGLAWAKFVRYGIFLAFPPAREACFR